MQKNDPVHSNRIPGPDILRAFAILSVFCWHYQNKAEVVWLSWVIPYGWAGVDLFFVLSGFLIASQLFRPFTLGETPSFKIFYLKRVLRILPAYLVVVAFYFLVPFWGDGRHLPPLWKFLTFTQNFNLDRSQTGGFSHAWSLCVEEHFYVALPIIVFLIHFARHRIKPKFFAFALPIAIFIIGMALRAMLWLKFISPALADPDRNNLANLYDRIIYYPSYNRLDGLLVGVVIALVFTFKPDFKKRLEHAPDLSALVGLIFLGLACWITADRTSFSAAVFGFPAFSLGFGGLIMSAVTERSIFNRLRIPGATLMATLAYTFYLTHKALIYLLYPVFKTFRLFQNETTMIIAVFIVSLAGAQLLHLLIERPFLNLRDRLILQKRERLPIWHISAKVIGIKADSAKGK